MDLSVAEIELVDSGGVPILQIQGEITREGRVSEPDIYWILGEWLTGHPEIKPRQKDIQISRGQWVTEDGLRTEAIRVTILPGDDIAGYDSAVDADLYRYYLAEERFFEAG